MPTRSFSKLLVPASAILATVILVFVVLPRAIMPTDPAYAGTPPAAAEPVSRAAPGAVDAGRIVPAGTPPASDAGSPVQVAPSTDPEIQRFHPGKPFFASTMLFAAQRLPARPTACTLRLSLADDYDLAREPVAVRCWSAGTLRPGACKP